MVHDDNPPPALLRTSFASAANTDMNPPPPPPGCCKTQPLWPEVVPPEEHPLFKDKLHKAVKASFSLNCANCNQSIYEDDSKRDQIPFRVVPVEDVLGPPFSVDFAKLSDANQKLFHSSWGSVNGVDNQRQWILLHVFAAGDNGKLTFFIPIMDAKYILIYDKKAFADQLEIFDRRVYSSYFGFFLKPVRKLLLLAMGKYVMKSAVTGDGRDWIDWRSMTSSSRFFGQFLGSLSEKRFLYTAA